MLRSSAPVALALASGALLLAATAAPAPAAGGAGVAASQAVGEREDDATFFRRRVLPILERSCLECHGPDVDPPQGGLVLDGTASLLRGGDGGPAVVPGDPEASALVHAVRYTDPYLEMPPDGPLAPGEVEVLEAWVARGAPWPAPPAEDAPAPDPDAPAPEPSHEDVLFFEQEVRPLLARSCFPCHGPEVAEPKSGLRMAGRAALVRGGDRGPALVPGRPDASRLVRAVRYDDPELRMPPDGRLPREDVAVLEAWVARGAPWPGGAAAADAAATPPEPGVDVAAGRERWAFSPVVRPEVPAVADPAWIASPIDAFVLARLEAAGLRPSPPATPRELVRRAYYVLLGLPPTPEELARHLADAEADREGWWERLVDELLARPEYGERWARHWLDVVRYAQTNGYERDAEKPYAWRYRDWVIDALNEDLPFDRFVAEQLAGDELPDADDEAVVATGFWRIGAWDDEPDDPRQARYDELDDSLRAIGEGMLGVTIGCARCHDHRFDPLSQEDYFGLLAFAHGVRPYEDALFALGSPTLRPLDRSAEALARWEEEREQEIRSRREEARQALREGARLWIQARLEELPPEVRAARRLPRARRTPEQQALLDAVDLEPTQGEARAMLPDEVQLALRQAYEGADALRESFEGSLPWALVVREEGPEPAPTRLHVRGRASTPGPEVAPRFPLALVTDDAEATPPPPEPTEASSGLRRRLAEWVTSPDNPLFARVIANRVWHHHLGRGIVATPNDFGAMGLPPTHPELLDWLASELVARGWSLKELHREVLRSSTWRQSSRATDPALFAAALEVDPANDLLWRQRRRRLEAEPLRDALLRVAGTLSDERGGRGFFPPVPREALAGMSKPGSGWEPADEAARDRRSVYAFVKRGMLHPFATVFDRTTASLPIGARPSTTTPTQALTLLNGELAGRQARALAERVAAEAGADPEARVRLAFERVLGRAPDAEERALLGSWLAARTAALAGRDDPLVVEPRVPERLAMDYVARLSGEDVLFAPREGWTAVRGAWGGGYNETLEPDPLRGPAAVCEAVAIGDGALEARLALEAGCTLASVWARAHAEGDVAHGVELALLPETGRAELRLHAPEGAEVLAAADEVALEPGRPLALRLELDGPRVRARLDGEPLLAAADPRLPAEGGVGLAARGAALVAHDLAVVAGDERVALEPDDAGPPELRALASLCLVLFNLNEFLYVD